MTTYILFDVDGVFNVWPQPKDLVKWSKDSGWSADKTKTETIYGYSITWSTELVNWVNALTTREDVVPIWLTTWCELAQTELGPSIGLNNSNVWRTLGSVNDRRSSFGWWKADHVRDFVGTSIADDDIVIWIDDDHSIFRDSTGRILELNPNVHVFEPWTHIGITREMTEEIGELLK